MDPVYGSHTVTDYMHVGLVDSGGQIMLGSCQYIYIVNFWVEIQRLGHTLEPTTTTKKKKNHALYICVCIRLYVI